MRRITVALVVGVIGLAGCTAQEDMSAAAMDELVLGPVDGHDLSGVDLDRVQVRSDGPRFCTGIVGWPHRRSLELPGREERRLGLLSGTLVTILR